MTAVKVVLEATSTYMVDQGPEYFIGLRHLDVGHVTFGKTGRLVFEYDMPAGLTGIKAVTPLLANASTGGGIDGAGSTKPTTKLFTRDDAVWSPYTLGMPAAGEIEAIKIETSMDLAPNGCTPVLIGFNVEYTKAQ